MKSVLIVLFLVVVFSQSSAQRLMENGIPVYQKSISNRDASIQNFEYIPKKPGHYTAEDWQAVIDSTWGEGLSTADKLKIFDIFWDEIDDGYPAFFNIDVDWNLLRETYRPEVATGVSRGRFNAIMNILASALEDHHTSICDIFVSRDSLRPGVPIFVPTGYQSAINLDWYGDEYCHFGASLAPMEDSSLFVYDIIENHPLDLQIGDLVLGYDGIPWKDLYREILNYELPIYGFGNYGSNKFSIEHWFITSAGENWHLFDTIDIVKYESGDTVHLATSLLENQKMKLLTTGQMPISGVPFPDVANGHWVSWGIIDGTDIGYIYAWNWTRNGDYPFTTTSTGTDFKSAIETLIKEYNVSGLIIDSRYNGGGWPEWNGGCAILFNQDQNIWEDYQRSDPDDHFAVEPFCYSCWKLPSDFTQFKADPYIFDKPIAVLTGTSSWSGGDLMPFQMRMHPMTRTFGLTTNGAFGIVVSNHLLYPTHPIQKFPEWNFRRTISDMKVPDYSNGYLTHLEIPPDEELWLTREDAVKGNDTVVKRALQWIRSMIHAYNVRPDLSFINPEIDTLIITTNVANPNNHNLKIAAIINTLDNVYVDSVALFDDGNHNDSLAGDGLFGGSLNPLSSEDIFTISASVTDLDSNYYHLLPNAKRFTTIGPLVVADTTHADSSYSNRFRTQFFYINVHNLGQSATATNLSVQLTTDDPRVLDIADPVHINDIAPGDEQSSKLTSFSYASGYGPDSTVNNPIQFTCIIYSDHIPFWVDTFEYITSVEDYNIGKTPTKFYLIQNYPNPFNPSTTIKFQIPNSEFTTLKVYDILGKEVSTLVSGKLNAGNYTYTFDGDNLASGIYYYQLVAGEYREVKKMILLH